MGNYVSCNCSCACIKSSSQKANWSAAAAAKAEIKEKLEKAILLVHSVEERVVEIGGGAPIPVAELMLEFPGHFVVQCETKNPSMDVKRATPLPADHEASPGRIYILFPMHRLHTRVAPHESACFSALLSSFILHSHLQQLLHNCSKKKSRRHSLMALHSSSASAKVAPISSLHTRDASHDDDDGGDAQIDDEIDLLLQHFCSTSQIKASSSCVDNNGGGAFINKSGSLVRSKSWIPKLETINESSILVV